MLCMSRVMRPRHWMDGLSCPAWPRAELLHPVGGLNGAIERGVL